ncbi:MAG: hypothetical protein ACO3JL_08780 [Myxococcota bacterium]
MSAILVLLALLSVATLFARRGFAAFVAHIVTAPLLLGVGALLSPRGLALLTPVTLAALEPAIRVAAAWSVLLVALRGSAALRDAQQRRATASALSLGALTWIGLSALLYGALSLLVDHASLFPALRGDDKAVLGLAVLLGGVLSTTGFPFAEEALHHESSGPAARTLLTLARHDDLFAALAVCLTIYVWPLSSVDAPVYEVPALASLLPMVLGGMLASSLWLSSGVRMGGVSASTIALVGLITFAAGLSSATRLPEATIAFFFGAALALFGQGSTLLGSGLHRTERPVRLVLYVLVGAQLQFYGDAVLLGVIVAMGRLMLKFLLRAFLSRSEPVPLPLSAFLGSAGTTLPFAVSFVLSRGEPLEESHLLTSVAVCMAVTDLLTLITWHRREATDSLLPPAVEEAS